MVSSQELTPLRGYLCRRGFGLDDAWAKRVVVTALLLATTGLDSPTGSSHPGQVEGGLMASSSAQLSLEVQWAGVGAMTFLVSGRPLFY